MAFGINKSKKKQEPKSKEKKPKEKKPINKKMVIKISITAFIIVLLLIITTLYTYNDNVRDFFDKYIFRKNVYENNLPFIEIDSIDAKNIYAYGKNIIVLEENILKAYNKMGNEEYSLDVKIKNPFFVSCGNYLCLADKNGKKIYLISGRNILWQRDLEGEISNISINKNGYIAVTTSDTGYKAIIEIYEPSRYKII